MVHPINRIVFSNKGIHMAVSWEGCNTVRVYSLHKQCSFVDIKHEASGDDASSSAVKTFVFDYYGHYLFTSAGSKVRAYYFKDFNNALAVFQVSADALAVDEKF